MRVSPPGLQPSRAVIFMSCNAKPWLFKRALLQQEEPYRAKTLWNVKFLLRLRLNLRRKGNDYVTRKPRILRIKTKHALNSWPSYLKKTRAAIWMFVCFFFAGLVNHAKEGSINRGIENKFHEAEQSCVTVCLLEKTETKWTPVRMMTPSGPGISAKGAKSRMYWVFPSFWYQTSNTFFHIGLGRDRRRNSKREGKVFFLSFVSYFWPG